MGKSLTKIPKRYFCVNATETPEVIKGFTGVERSNNQNVPKDYFFKKKVKLVPGDG